MSCALKVARSFGGGGEEGAYSDTIFSLQHIGARELKYSDPGNSNSAFPAF